MITSFLTKRWLRHVRGLQGHEPPRRIRGLHGRAFVVRVAAVLTGGGAALALAAGPAGAQATAAPPMPGVMLGAAAAPGAPTWLFYTGTDRQVWTVDLSNMAQHVPYALGGQLIGAPAAVWIPPGPLSRTGETDVFGRGTDNRLWWRHQTASGYRWTSLGGNLSSKPTVAADDNNLLIYARGADGAVWGRREYPRAGQWYSWHKIGGQLLKGTAPAAGYNALGVFIAVAGTDHAVWVDEELSGSAGFTWHRIGGRTNSTPGLDVPGEQSTRLGQAVAFARGTGNVAWYNEFRGQTAGVTAGWHSLGGTLTSGLTAISDPVTGYTSVFALGPDNRPWENTGTWPALGGWGPVPIDS
jgi:hypothetical protein